MLNCERFRLLAGADPRHLSWAQRLHRLTCRGCERYLRMIRRLDAGIEQALELDVSAAKLDFLSRVGRKPDA